MSQNPINEKYDHKKIEADLIKDWKDQELYKTEELNEGDEKFYSLYSFPYPSGSGLHVGHAEGMVANDIVARYYRMLGRKITLPMGWDSFGLPAENYAIKTGVHPKDSTEEAIATFIEQIDKLGIMVDWEKEVGAHRPDYYKWTQWFFTQLYKHGLAYKANSPVNWCPKDQTVLANEQVIEGKCERCDSEVEKKDMDQWFFRITDYADRLIDELDQVDWPEPTKLQQRNWIGRSYGARVSFQCSMDKGEILFATGNKSKVKRLEKLIKYSNLSIDVMSPSDIGLEALDTPEEGNLIENAIEKVEAYRGKTDLPIIAVDTGLFIDGEELDPVRVGRNAIEGFDEKELSQEEIAQKMQSFYIDIAVKNGGEVDAYFVDAIAVLFPNGEIKTAEAKRDVVITDKPSGELDIYFPINSIYKVKPFDKYYGDIEKEEELQWLNPFTGVLKEFFGYDLEVFTTAHDTIYGTTFMVVAPEHEIITNYELQITNYDEVEKYIEKSKLKTDLERTDLNKDKSGVLLEGIHSINPVNGMKIPIFVADYVLGGYGTGAIMAVPGHDERDFEFAQKYGIDVIYVAEGDEYISYGKEIKANKAGFVVKNSEKYDGMTYEEARPKMLEMMEEEGFAKAEVTFRLRDWLISRQRYWGAPIPAIHKKRGVPDKVLIIHGFGGNGEENWQPWLKESLDYKLTGSEVISPDFPNPNAPILGEWLGAMDKYKLGENSSIVAHSSGGYAALKYAEENKLKQLILVAPTNTANKDYWEGIRNNYSKFPVDQLLGEFYIEELEIEKIIENVDEIVMIFGEDDPYISGVTQEQFEEQFGDFNNVEVRILLNAGHMGGYEKCKELPILLEYFTDKQFKVLDTKDLPLMLPMDVDFIPKGYSPLSRSEEYIKNVRKKYGEEWSPEFDTMDTFVCSSWYFFRFCDPKNSDKLADSDLMNKWLPADLYMIGSEHIVLHLMYARFFTKFLKDLGMIDFDEPFAKMRHMGIIAGPDGRKMSKRWGNVINPNDVVEAYGADTLRVYEMFMGPLDQGKAWNDSSVQGVRRFLDRVYQFAIKAEFLPESDSAEVEINKLIKKVTEDTKDLKFNTSVAAFMGFFNFAEKNGLTKDAFEKFVLVLAPYAPYLSEYIWQNILKNDGSVHRAKWPEFDEKLLISQKISIGVQIMGKSRGVIEIAPKASEEEVIVIAKENDKVAKYLQNGFKKVIYVEGRILNFII